MTLLVFNGIFFRDLNLRFLLVKHNMLKTNLLTYLFTYLLTYLLTPWKRVLLEKLNGSAASQEIPRIFGTRRFLTVPTSARHLSLSWANSIRSPQPPPTSWRSILILSSHLRLGLPNGLFPLRFPHQNLVHISPLPHTRYMPRPSHSSRFCHPHNIG